MPSPRPGECRVRGGARSPVRALRLGQQLLEPLLCTEWAHLLRQPLAVARGHSFAIARLERRKWGIVERLVAHKPPGQRFCQ